MNLAAGLATRATELQIGGNRVSFGKENKTSSFIDEPARALTVAWSIKNETTTDKFILFTGLSEGLNNTIFQDSGEILAASGAQALFGNGVIFQDAGVDGGALTVTSLDSRRKVDQLVRYAGVSPLRFTKWSMTSAKVDGTKESSNYNNKMKSFWWSPLEDTVPVDLDIRPLQQGGNNFNTDMLDIDFQMQGGSFKPIMSNENGFVIQVNKGTILTITASVGAQLSQAQEFYRIISDADSIMAPARRQLA